MTDPYINQLYLPTELCKLGMKYGADKASWVGHNYTPFYYEYLKPYRFKFKKILEVGVGNNRQVMHLKNGVVGASLRMWRDFFPNAMVYGGDKAKECIFEDERLKTFYCDAYDKESVENLVKQTGSDIDLVIDDALHHIHSQIFLFKHLMPLLKKDVIYIVEDCMRTRVMRNMFPQYDSFSPHFLPNESPTLVHDKHYIRDGMVIFKNK